MTIRRELALFLREAQISWWRDAVEKNSRAKMTQRGFARWLGIPEQTLSDLILADREPSELQIHRIGKKLPEVYEAIGKPELAKRAGMEDRKQRRLERITRIGHKLDDRDLAKLEQIANSLLPDEGENGEENNNHAQVTFITDANHA
jgi:plasmid maintenance system antidote protein VapI